MHKKPSLICRVIFLCTLLSGSAQARPESPRSPGAICLQVQKAFRGPLPPPDNSPKDEGINMASHPLAGVEWATLYSLIRYPRARMFEAHSPIQRADAPLWFEPSVCGEVKPICRSRMGMIRSQIYQYTDGPLTGIVIAIDTVANHGMGHATLTFYTPDYVHIGIKLDLLDIHTCAAKNMTVARSTGRSTN